MSVISIPTFGEILAVSASRGQNSEAPHLWQDAVGLWPMQEGGGGTAFDVSGWGKHGTLTNMTPSTDWTTGRLGHALTNFSGTDHVYTTYSPVIATRAFGFWATWAAGYYQWCGSAGPNSRFYIGWSSDDTHLYAGWGDRYAATAGTPGISDSDWHFYLLNVPYDNKLQTWFDGRLLYTHVSASTWGNNGRAIEIGDCFGYNYPWSSGKITNAFIAERPLVAAEIQQLYAEPWAMYTPRAKIFGAVTVPSGDVSGTSNGVFSVTGAIAGAGAITGDSDGVFSVTGNIAASGVLTGGSDGVFSVAGNIAGAGAVASGSDGAFSVTGGISGVSGLVGDSDGVFSVTGAIVGSGSLGGSSDGVFTVTGAIIGAGSVAGSSDGVFSVTSAIGDGEVDPITGSVACAFTVTGAIIGSSGEKYSLYLSGQVAGDIYISGGSAGDIYSSGLAAGAVKSR